MIYNREDALSLLGAICNNLDLLRDRKYDISLNDFDDLFHKGLFGVLSNLSLENDLKTVDGFMVDTYLRKFPVQHKNFEINNGVELVEKIKEYKGISFDYSYKNLKKMSLLRRFNSIGFDISEILDFNTLDVVKLQTQRVELEKKSIDDIKQHFKKKLIDVEQDFQTRGDAYSFKAGEDIEELLKTCETEKHWGITFQSKLFNSVFRGMIGSKLMIRSAGTGGGKTRQSIGDMCNISCYKRYIPSEKKWVINNDVQYSLLISTELTKEEVHLAMLSTVAGVAEEVIKNGRYTSEVKERLVEATKVIKESKILCEYNSNFSIGEIENSIEKNIIRNGVKFIFFDYIQVTANLAQELNRLFGYILREDQMLNQLSTALKNIANKYDVFILTSTQLNRNYKSDTYLDATHLRGGKWKA